MIEVVLFPQCLAVLAAALPWIVAGLSAVSAGVSAYGTIQQGKAAQKEAEYAAKVDENNAKIEMQNAQLADEAATREAILQRRNLDRAISETVNATSGSGLSLSGSALDVIADSANEGFKDISMGRYRGTMESRNFGNSAGSLSVGAGMKRMAGRNAKASSYIGAAGTIIGGISSGISSFGATKANFKKN